MKKRLLALLGGSFLSAMFLVGCGTNDDNDPAPENDNNIMDEDNNDVNEPNVNEDVNDNNVNDDANDVQEGVEEGADEVEDALDPNDNDDTLTDQGDNNNK
ncbi:hypothetical protein [Peribacillus asahii]|uniref:hypothetical protein n=1 Tax=Peribacillus asahii TaxID=228899 RepID=UPI002079B1F8|nr:hypothetical protein [Peribacillus asahii]USK70064.1 hypothetical protein LIS76_21660 [Peribacillus asahii]